MAEAVTETTETPLDRAELTRRRWLARLKQWELAELAGISTSQISRIESGKVGASPATLGRLADALGCTVADLLRKVPA